ncbi:MAG: UDP-N-acetylmuramate--L-alanine ligase [Armatimonadetes bacterium]|nr:UDP-N-acetylmuramate--L-alanine ligase [Armatimonadota bacterium]
MKVQDIRSVHFIGIGGIGMSALAKLLLHRGAAVSGSDMKDSAILQEIRSLGAIAWPRHDASHVPASVDLVVMSAAIPPHNPERMQAQKLGLPVISRAQMLGQIMEGCYGIAVTGTHGKTTTTGMAGLVLAHGGLDPTILVGGEMAAFGGNLRIGKSRIFLTEACEAFDSFLHLFPDLAVLTNIDADHLDYHHTMEHILDSFDQFLNQTAEDGLIIACADDARVESLVACVNRRVLRYGISEKADLRAAQVYLSPWGSRFSCLLNGEVAGEVRLNVPGRQNIQNALAALAVGLEAGLSFDAACEGLGEFHGVGRRMELLGTAREVMVVDDYAHHPTEIKATLQAAKESWSRRVVAVFQPHLYSRTRLLLDDFGNSFGQADVAVITEIYPAREQPIEGVTGRLIADEIVKREPGKAVHFVSDKNDVPGFVAGLLKPGDVMLTLGAGDIRDAGEKLLEMMGGPASSPKPLPPVGDACGALG